ncbi:MAG: type VII toxin-antitoxin system HepT family RNase toxin [Caulobacteraceae bacterium]
MQSDVIINKAAIIERCIKRIHEEYEENPENLNNFTKQDSIILNIQRAAEACIDMAMHIVAEKSYGIPQNSRDAFDLLQANEFITKELCNRLKAMVGFRNIAVHDYKNINIHIVQKIIENNLDDIKEFTAHTLKL